MRGRRRRVTQVGDVTHAPANAVTLTPMVQRVIDRIEYYPEPTSVPSASTSGPASRCPA